MASQKKRHHDCEIAVEAKMAANNTVKNVEG
jgi:hypothetical protein